MQSDPKRYRKVGLLSTGAVVGAVVGLAMAAALFWSGVVPPKDQAKLADAMPAALLALITLGALAAAYGRDMLDHVEPVLLGPDVSDGARLIFRVVAATALLVFVQHYVLAFLLADHLDLPTFLLAARALAAGENIYDPAVLAAHLDEGMPRRVIMPYIYLPFFALLLRPLAELPLTVAYPIFLLLNSALWPLLAYLCLRLIDPPHRLRMPLAALTLLLLTFYLPSVQTINRGSPSLLVACLVVGALLLERQGRSRTAGVLLAAVTLIKVVPILALGYLALRRRLRAVSAAAVSGAVMLGASVLAAGLEPHLQWFRKVAPSLATAGRTDTFWQPACTAENQSLTGFFCHLLGKDGPYLPAAAGAGVLVLALAALVLWRRRGPGLDALEISLLSVVMLMVSTVTWFHHMTLMLLPGLTLVVEATRLRGRLRGVVASTALLVNLLVGLSYYINPWPYVTFNLVTASARFAALALALGALLLVVARRREAQSEQRVTEIDELPVMVQEPLTMGELEYEPGTGYEEPTSLPEPDVVFALPEATSPRPEEPATAEAREAPAEQPTVAPAPAPAAPREPMPERHQAPAAAGPLLSHLLRKK